jgi:3-hydroxyisobutyrate dehydrogenase-like beta-hydroxyacid dehydrogenase
VTTVVASRSTTADDPIVEAEFLGRGHVTSIGIIGLGEMGFAMATRLISQGHTVIGFDPSPERADAAERAGVALRPSPAAVTEDSDDAVLVNVGTEAHLASAWRDPDGALSAIKGRTLVVMSTFDPHSVEAVAQEAEAAGGAVVDAPHTGSKPAALTGDLIVWLAGTDVAVERVRPVIEVLASKTHVIGPRPGMAQVVKLINAMGLAINLSAVTEMLSIAQLYGLDGDLVLRVIEGGSGSSWVSSAMPGVASYLTAHHIRNLRKDLGLALVEATRAGCSMPITSATMHSIRYTWPRTSA